MRITNATAASLSFSYEVDPEGLDVLPMDSDGYSIGGFGEEVPDFSRTVIDESSEEGGFHDPSPEQPMEASKFLSFLDPIGVFVLSNTSSRVPFVSPYLRELITSRFRRVVESRSICSDPV